MRAVSGPIGVVSTSSSLVGEGFLGLANLFVILSYGVALSNLLPIPALDGSHIVFALLKAVRLEPSLRAREGLVLVGMVLLLILGLLVAIKDVVALMH
jgi:regulator of sigma E protease